MRSSNYGKYNNFSVVKLIKPLLILALLAVVFVVVMFLYYSATVPDPSVISSRKVNESTKIYDKTGQSILYDIHGEEKRTIVPWDQIPQNVKNATLASEDSGFYIHNG